MEQDRWRSGLVLDRRRWLEPEGVGPDPGHREVMLELDGLGG